MNIYTDLWLPILLAAAKRHGTGKEKGGKEKKKRKGMEWGEKKRRWEKEV